MFNFWYDEKRRALSIISQYAKGTFLIRFSKQNAASLVLVVSTGRIETITT